jgi:DNA-binding response OmpR family regulator
LKNDNPYILMVEDSALVSERLTGILHDTGFPWRTVWARSYGQVMDMLAGEAALPAIVVLDINLPGKSGLQLLRAIKAAHHGLIVIMLTNQADDYYRKLAQSLGADYFLDKSNDFEQLPGLLLHLMDIKR